MLTEGTKVEIIGNEMRDHGVKLIGSTGVISEVDWSGHRQCYLVQFEDTRELRMFMSGNDWWVCESDVKEVN